MKVVILGCGRTGSLLAQRLVARGHKVSVIDQSQEAFARLGPDFPGDMVVGPGIDEDVLIQAGIEEADAFIAVTPDDNTNLMAAQVVKELFHSKRVVARVYDPQKQELYQSLGLEVVSPTLISVQQLEERVLGEVGD